MRHSKQELAELLLRDAPQFIEALGAGIDSVAKLNFPGIYASNKRALFSHHVRSGIFDYLDSNPIKGYRLNISRHRLNQSVTLEHESGLEIRYAKLRDIVPEQVPIPNLDEDPSLSNALFGLDLQFQDPGLLALSWGQPKLDKDGYPLDELEMTAVRLARGTKLTQGIADAIIPLTSQNHAIPEAAFDPNEDDLTYKFEMDEEEDGA